VTAEAEHAEHQRDRGAEADRREKLVGQLGPGESLDEEPEPRGRRDEGDRKADERQ